MKIRTQFIVTVALFGATLLIVGASVIVTNRKLAQLRNRERVAAHIERGISDLNYLSNEYLLYRENQQRARWESKFASILNDLASVKADHPEQQEILKNMRENLRRLKEVFAGVASLFEGASHTQSALPAAALIQVSRSRLAVQSQGIYFDALRLSRAANNQTNQLRQMTDVLSFALIGLFGASLVSFYALAYRRTLKGISELLDGTKIVGTGNLEHALPVKHDDEIGELSHAFNQMTANLKEVTASKSAFAKELVERKRAVEALRQSEERLSLAVDGAGMATWDVDMRTGQAVWSRTHFEILGYPPHQNGEATMEMWRSRVHPDDLAGVTRELEAARAAGSIYAPEHRIIRADNREVRWISVFGRFLCNDAGEAIRFVGIVFDSTRRKQAEESLQQLNESLEQRVTQRTAEAQRLADQLRALATALSKTEQRERVRLATVLHDHIQQLLVAALMQLGAIRRDDPHTIQSAAEETESIIKEAIDASRSLAVELSPPVLHQAGLAAGLAWLANRMQQKHLFKVHLQTDHDADTSDESVRFLLFGAVRELLLNAVKHSAVQEAHVAMLRTQEGWTKIIVEDNGRGFDPIGVRARQVADGSFGLFSIQQRLAHLGGRLEIESAPGRGTCITLMMPPEQAATIAQRAVDAVPAPAAPDVAPLRGNAATAGR